MTNQRRLLLVLLPVAVVVAASWLLLRADPEPSYQGKPLGWWLRRCDPVNAAQE